MDTNSIKQNKWVWRTLWVVGSLLVLWVLSWALVPPLLKSQLQKLASEELGRQVTVGDIDFKPWTLELALTDLAIAQAASTSPQLLVKRIYVNAELQSLLRLAPVIDAVAVDGLSLNVTHLGDGKYDVDDILARLTKPSAKPPSGPPRFAIFNIALSGGQMDFNDKAVGVTHQLRDLAFAIPFLSNLASDIEVKTAPRLAFKFNGSTFDSAAQATPFAQTSKTDATVRLSGLDLKPYLGYVPANIPVRLLAAVLDVDVKLAFEQSTQPKVKLTGTVQAKGIKVADAQAQDLLSLDSLKVALEDVRPLEKVVRLSSIEIDAPTLDVRRETDGHINLVPRAGDSSAMKKVANNSVLTGTSATSDAELGGWKLEIAKVAVAGGTVHWADQTTTPKAGLALRSLALEAQAIAMPFREPLQITGSASLVAGDSKGPGASLSFKGSATDQVANLDVSMADVPLALASPYLAEFLVPSLKGALSAQVTVDWKATNATGAKAGTRLAVKQLTLDNLALMAAGSKSSATSPLASLKKLELAQTQIDLDQHTVQVGKLLLTQPVAQVERDSDKHWMYEAWLKSPPASPLTDSVPSSPPGAKAVAGKPLVVTSPALPREDKDIKANTAPPWRVVLADISLEGGAIQFVDRAPVQPVAFEVSAIKVQAKNFALDGKTPSPLVVSARIRSAQGEPGQLDFKGNLGLTPLSAQGNVVASQIPVQVFEPYFANVINVKLLRADAGFKGDVSFSQANAAGPQVKVTGDVVVEEFKANTLVAGSNSGGTGTLQAQEELLAWKALGLRGLALTMAPGTATQVAVRETALTDFFARITINPKGQINLQNLGKPEADPAGVTASATANSVAINSTVTGTLAPKSLDSQAAAITVPANSPPGAAAQAPDPLAPVINVGPISLVNGRVYFSDYFVKPNYSANLSELTGRLSAFSSDPGAATVQMADLELRGRAEGTASLEILGKLNPLAKPLALDIKAKVRDLELPPLSPYSVKYAGHGIERGKLSVDVAYLVKPDGQLEASNNIILNQLTFGEKVEGAENSLPVKLAVALLSDSNGVIDINLPISGSLSDPQFRLGPIIFKVIVNLIVKAITSPFSLLASAIGGGGDELSMVGFAPGSAVLSPQATAGLDKVAKALTDRPALKLTVIGTADLEIEREDFKRARLEAMIAAEKRRAVVAGGSNANAGSSSPVTLTAAERSTLLKEVYKRSDVTKPRNLVGMAKDIPDADMEALLLASIKVTDDVIRELALQRGVAVKDYLASKQLPSERLFMGAVKSSAEARPDAAQPAKETGKWTPRAELNLATR